MSIIKSMSGIQNLNVNGNINTNTLEYSKGIYFSRLKSNIQNEIDGILTGTNTTIINNYTTISSQIQNVTSIIYNNYTQQNTINNTYLNPLISLSGNVSNIYNTINADQTIN